MHALDQYWRSNGAPSTKDSLLFKDCLLIKSATEYWKSADLVISGGRILGLWPSSERSKHQGQWQQEVDASRFIICPGLINAHTHVALSFLRGISHGRRNMIEDFFFKTESKLTAELLEALSYSYIYDGLRSGVTVFGDHYYFIEGVAAALNRVGVRGVVGETICDLGGAFTGRGPWDRARKTIESWSYGPRVKPLIAPHAADTVSETLLKELGAYAKTHKLPLHMHLSQTKGEYERVSKRAGMSPVAYAQQCGALSPNSLVVHLVSSTAKDQDILRDTGATVGFCPASQMIYEHVAPLNEFLARDIPVAVATDCAPSNDASDLWSELKLTGLMAKHLGAKADAYTPEALFKMLTENPAKVFGIDNICGSIDAQKAADLVFIERDLITEPHPHEHPLAALIYAGGSRNVSHVMVDGSWVLWQRQPCKISASDMQAQYEDARKTILARAGLG